MTGDDSDDEKEKEGEIDDLGDYENNEEEITKLLGFGGFGTTKGTAVEDNQQGAAHGAVSKHKERKYRQYMNRKAGFNRPLQSMP
jgi:U4/U6.U5 tri-snRNP-associated protein 3